MKKLFTIAIALLTVFALVVPAYAVTYSRDTVVRETDELGNDVKRVYGTIAFDSDYPCNTTTDRCGEALLPTQIGMTTLTHMFIESEQSGEARSLLFFDYDSAYTTGAGGTGGIRAYLWTTNLTEGGSIVSAPTYDLSALTAVPFEAIGT